MARGILWGVSILFLTLAIDKIGLAKSNQWKGLAVPFGTILMITLLGDVLGAVKIVFVMAGMFAMFVSAVLFTIRRDSDNKRAVNVGILFALGTAVCSGVNAYLQME